MVQSIAIQLNQAHQNARNTLAHLKQRNPYADLSDTQKIEKAISLLQSWQATLVAHYYVDAQVQKLADLTGGVVSDSLEMARFGRDCGTTNLIVAGVRFMGETAKILTPHKRVFMPRLDAECSLDIACPASSFRAFKKKHPQAVPVVYANTSAEVKAEADWVVTSSIALPLIKHLQKEGKTILFAPDKHLGQYLQSQSGVDMILWDGACVVHENFKAGALLALKNTKPEALILAHPESPLDVLEMADFVGSTSQIIAQAQKIKAPTYIIATESGIFHKIKLALSQTNAYAEVIEAPNAGNGATCQSCAQCPWMAMNQLDLLLEFLENPQNKENHEITLDFDLSQRAQRPINRMLEFASKYQKATDGDA